MTPQEIHGSGGPGVNQVGEADGRGVLPVLAAGWAFRRPQLAAAYQRVTGGDRTEAYLTSRVLTREEAQELAGLGWTPAHLRRLVRFERPRRLVPDPVPVDEARPDPAAPERRWTPPENRPDLPRRAELPFAGLVAWARLRPGDRDWLAGITVTELRRLGRPQVLDTLRPYLTSPLGVDPGTALLQAQRYVPFTLFETVVTARGGMVGMAGEWIDVVLGGRWIHEVPEWETAGWISHPAQTPLLFSPVTGDGLDPSTRWERWHPVARLAGPDGIHPADWWAAGFSVDEALRAFDRGRVPDRSVLEAMAVVRGKTGPRG
ncbi:hypothetical protein KIH74_19340 [Kineosporia sp. J2-2]|uniref:Uncharacterized protein n=1 Tax=Kineosporia corallincola TaxID=2835133 RepID=A0ABS5TM24_9ACTN|nr:hypothetical protein [Kineosporia corallincola]MBT0771103.1 hypothetical protein [Kineosporia corallincola]